MSVEDLDLDYAGDIHIKEDALDVEWLQQPELMRKYSKHAADTKAHMDALKERLEFTRASLELDIRRRPYAYGLEKVTEAAIQSTILVQTEYQEQVEEYRKARYENDIAQGAVRALDQKKTALENLVRLLGQDYFAGPVAPRDLSKEWAERAKEVERRNHNARVRLQRRTKHEEQE